VRSLFVIVAAAAIAAQPARTSAALVAPHPGQSVTQTDLFGYLFVPPQPGDWLRYQITVNGELVVTKTIGFGSDETSSGRHAYLEIQTQTPGVTSLPVSGRSLAGGNITWKMFVDAPNFSDSLRSYSFAGGIIKIGDSFFRLGGGPTASQIASARQSLPSLLMFGWLPMPDARDGTVLASTPEDLRVAGFTLHTVHTIVDFSRRSLGGGTGLPESELETWQTTDVPLGLVRVEVRQSGGVFSMNLIGFGRKSYREVITKDITAVPYFPGS
jgi:hypothetical protein